MRREGLFCFSLNRLHLQNPMNMATFEAKLIFMGSSLAFPCVREAASGV
jgi:hypothetical protein